MNIYFVGIKGSGMSALATILKDRGNHVSGSDVDKIFFTDDKLNAAGIEVQPFAAEIPNDTDVVILGNAFADDHAQVLDAKAKGIDVIRYYNYLNQFANLHAHSVAVAGTNGKTTTTSMLVSMLKSEMPSYLIGDGNGFGNKADDTFIFEACEYRNTFYNYHPEYAIINNVEMDHPDFFKDLDDVINTFQNFADNANQVIVNMDDEPSMRLVSNQNKFYYFSKENTAADMYMQNIKKSASGFGFDLYFQGTHLGRYDLPFYGDHMIQNTLSSLLVGHLIGHNTDQLVSDLTTFGGAKRRFEKYEIDINRNLTLIDDYAHHPTAIELTIDAIRQQYPDRLLTVLFQPHTYSRTIEFLDQFAETLQCADKLYLEPIFGSIREAKGEISIDDLKAKVAAINPNVLIDSYKQIDPSLDNQVICLLGAGDIDKIYIPKIMQLFEEN